MGASAPPWASGAPVLLLRYAYIINLCVNFHPVIPIMDGSGQQIMASLEPFGHSTPCPVPSLGWRWDQQTPRFPHGHFQAFALLSTFIPHTLHLSLLILTQDPILSPSSLIPQPQALLCSLRPQLLPFQLVPVSRALGTSAHLACITPTSRFQLFTFSYDKFVLGIGQGPHPSHLHNKPMIRHCVPAQLGMSKRAFL